MGCMSTLGRIILIVLNLVFLLISLALIAGGVILKFFAGKIVGPVLGSLDVVKDDTRTALNIPDFKDVNGLPLLDDVGVFLIAFGCILLVVSFCACCGACGKWRLLLIVFIILMSILVIIQAVVGGLFLAKDSILHDTIKKKLGNKIRDEYDPNGNDVFTFSINILNYLLDCCGISGWDDFSDNKPVMSCCHKDKMTDVSGLATCKKPTANSPDFYNEGCYTKLQDKVRESLTIAAVILALLLLLQAAEIVFAIAIVQDVGKVGPM